MSKLKEFCVHILVGAGLFLLIAIPAVGLSFLIRLLERFGIDGFLLYGLITVEYFIFIVDLMMFVLFIALSANKTGRALWIERL